MAEWRKALRQGGDGGRPGSCWGAPGRILRSLCVWSWVLVRDEDE